MDGRMDRHTEQGTGLQMQVGFVNHHHSQYADFKYHFEFEPIVFFSTPLATELPARM